MVKFFGNILLHLSDLSGSYVLAIILFALMSALLLSPLIRTNTMNVLICKALSSRIYKITNKYPKNDKRKYDELFELSSKYGVAMVSHPICSALEILLGFLMTLGFRLPEVASADPQVSGFSLGTTVVQSFRQNGFVIPLVVLIVLAGVVEMMYDADVQDDFIVDMTPINFIKRIVSFVIALVLPCAFLIYWIAFEVIEFIVLEYVTRWRENHFIERLKVQLKKKGKTI